MHIHLYKMHRCMQYHWWKKRLWIWRKVGRGLRDRRERKMKGEIQLNYNLKKKIKLLWRGMRPILTCGLKCSDRSFIPAPSIDIPEESGMFWCKLYLILWHPHPHRVWNILMEALLSPWHQYTQRHGNILVEVPPQSPSSISSFKPYHPQKACQGSAPPLKSAQDQVYRLLKIL